MESRWSHRSREQVLMHMGQAFKRRGNMSYDDSRAGNATSEVCPVRNRIRDDMRIVCLIAVGAFLLSVAMAEGDVPIGTPQYHHRMNRPIILEPVKRYTSSDNANPLQWFFKMVSRAMDPPKTSPRMIGPINLPGMGGHVYIKQTEDGMPWESNHVVIRLVTRDPMTGLASPMETKGILHNRPYQAFQNINNPPLRVNNMIQQNFGPSPASPDHSSHSSWMNQHHQRPQQLPKLRPNDYRYDNFGKVTDQSFSKGYPADFYETQRPFVNNYQQFQPNPEITHPKSPNSVRSSQIYQPISHQVSTDHDHLYKENLQNSNRNYYNGNSETSRTTPYPVYPPLREEDHRSSIPRKIGNESQSMDVNSDNVSRGPARYRSVIRTDRMVPIPGNHRTTFPMKTRPRSAKSQVANDSGSFRESSSTKFDAKDVGGIEVIAAPNLKIGWNREIGNNKAVGRSSSGSDSDMNHDEDSMSMSNGKNLARGESAEHENEPLQIVVDQPSISRRSQSRISYNVIDRIHRSRGSNNASSESFNNPEKRNSKIDRIDNSKNKSVSDDRLNETTKDVSSDIGRVERTTRMSNVTAEVVQKVMNLTASNGWKSQERRKHRIVKAIYRREPRIGVIKSSKESSESSEENN